MMAEVSKKLSNVPLPPYCQIATKQYYTECLPFP